MAPGILTLVIVGGTPSAAAGDPDPCIGVLPGVSVNAGSCASAACDPLPDSFSCHWEGLPGPLPDPIRIAQRACEEIDQMDHVECEWQGPPA